jgi:hypothetical protein
MAATMIKAHDTRHDVRLGKRLIGFIVLFTIRNEAAWRFLPNRKDIAERFPAVAPKHATAADALAYINAEGDF